MSWKSQRTSRLMPVAHVPYPIYVRIKQLNPSWRAIWTILRSLFRFYVNVAPHTSSDTHRKACSQTASKKSHHTEKQTNISWIYPIQQNSLQSGQPVPPHNDQRLFPLLESFSGVKLSRNVDAFLEKPKKMWLDKENKELADSWWISMYSTWGVLHEKVQV